MIALALVASARVSAAVLRVGPHDRYVRPCQAIAAARPGDTIEIDARGSRGYAGDVCTWRTSRLSIRGVHGRAHIDAAGRNSAGKGIWVIDGNDTRIEDVELSGAAVPDRNGAGIRLEGRGLIVSRSEFDHDQDGILTNPDPASDIVVDSSEFAFDGAGDGYSHNIYVGLARSFTLRYSYSHDAVAGHLVKSRALVNRILYNRLTGETGTDSYELDLPQGGRSYVIGNVIEQGPRSENPAMLAYAEEGARNPHSELFVLANTFVNDLGRGPALLVGAGAAPALVEDNLLAGSRQLSTQSSTISRANCITSAPRFLAPRRYDYHLRRGSPCIDAGRPVPRGLRPTEQYVYDLRHQRRAVFGRALDAGAFEYRPS